MTHLIVDELRRQFEAGEISCEYYEAMRRTEATAPAENKCATPGCTRQAYRIDRGKTVCAVCFQKAETQRRRGW